MYTDGTLHVKGCKQGEMQFSDAWKDRNSGLKKTDGQTHRHKDKCTC